MKEQARPEHLAVGGRPYVKAPEAFNRGKHVYVSYHDKLNLIVWLVAQSEFLILA